jgi:hypothetical protein
MSRDGGIRRILAVGTDGQGKGGQEGRVHRRIPRRFYSIRRRFGKSFIEM